MPDIEPIEVCHKIITLTICRHVAKSISKYFMKKMYSNIKNISTNFYNVCNNLVLSGSETSSEFFLKLKRHITKIQSKLKRLYS